MNIFLEYHKKIFNSLKVLKKLNLIEIPNNLKFTIETPPKNQSGDISTNVSLVLAKFNKTSPINLAEIIKKHLIKSFKEFKNIEIAGPGFLNITYYN